MNPGEILSKAWQLYRRRFLNIIGYFFVPVLIFAIIFIWVNDRYYPLPLQVIFKAVQYPEIIILAICIIVTASFRYIRIFYNYITDQNVTPTYLTKFVRLNIANIIKIALLVTFELTIFLILNTIVLVLVAFLINIAGTVLEQNIQNTTTFVFIALLLMLCFMVAIYIYLYVLSFQVIFCFLEIAAVSCDDIPVKYAIVIAFKIIQHNFLNYLQFVFLFANLFVFLFLNFYFISLMFLFLISMLINSVVKLPSTYTYQTVSDVFSFSLALILLWPFAMSSITMYFCDYKARKQGFDLLQRIESQKNFGNDE